MSAEHYIMYNLSGEQPVMKGWGPVGVTAIQQPPTGWDALTLPADVVNGDIDDYPVEIRMALWERVKVIRDAVIGNGVPTPLGLVDSDPTSRDNISGAATAAVIAKMGSAPFSITWTLQDNTTVTLDADGMMSMGLAVVSHINGAHEQARVLRAALEGAEDVAALLQIDVRSGW